MPLHALSELKDAGFYPPSSVNLAQASPTIQDTEAQGQAPSQEEKQEKLHVASAKKKLSSMSGAPTLRWDCLSSRLIALMATSSH